MDRPSTASAEFFDRLGQRGHEPLLEDVDGTIRFDLTDERGTQHWHVTIEDGDVRVSREASPADCIVYTDRIIFDRFVTGQLRTMPAWLRYMFRVEGNAGLMRVFDRVLPSPAGARHPRDIVRDAGRHK